MPANTAEKGFAAREDEDRPLPPFQFHHIPELDGFRGLAVLMVVAGHYLEFRAPENPYLATLDRLGVLLFFVLSGFLITGLLYRERLATGKINFRFFYIRRILRLAPAFLLLISVTIVLMRFGVITDVSRQEILECLLYIRNIFGHSQTLGHIWSLSLEEQFYLLWPLSFSLLPLKRSPTIVLGACLLLMLSRGLAIHAQRFSYSSGVYYERPYFRFDSILIGAFLILWLSSSARAVSFLTRVLSRIPALLLWSILFVWTMFAESWTHAWHLSIQEGLVALCLGQVVLHTHGALGKFMRLSALRYCGTISYSLYLWQQMFLVTSVPSWGPFRRFPLEFIVPFSIAAASYRFLEKPILRWKDRLAPQPSR
jgi:peptidoglycan/LPS O-acetylase OafA/YrhL